MTNLIFALFRTPNVSINCGFKCDESDIKKRFRKETTKKRAYFHDESFIMMVGLKDFWKAALFFFYFSSSFLKTKNSLGKKVTWIFTLSNSKLLTREDKKRDRSARCACHFSVPAGSHRDRFRDRITRIFSNLAGSFGRKKVNLWDSIIGFIKAQHRQQLFRAFFSFLDRWRWRRSDNLFCRRPILRYP